PALAVRLQQPGSDSEDPARLGDVLANDYDAVVCGHRLVKTEVETLHHGQLAHSSFCGVAVSPAAGPGGGPRGFTSGGRSTEPSSASPSSKLHGRPEA